MSMKMMISKFLYSVQFLVLFFLGIVSSYAQDTSDKVRFEFNKSTDLNEESYLGKRFLSSIDNRLLTIDLEAILEPYRHRPGAQEWIGEHIGKYLHAATLSYRHSKNKALKERIDYAASELMKCQLPDGYLGTYEDEKRWTSWDVWSHKYNLIGLLSYYEVTGNEQALASCKRMADLLTKTFGPGKKDIIASGTHVGMAPTSVLQPLVKLYEITQKEAYLQFCHYLVDSWEQENGPKIISSLLSTGNVFKTANNKAYEMMSDLVGLIDLYKVSGNPDYLTVVENAWKDITNHRLYLHGTTSYEEHFQEDHDLNPEGKYQREAKFSGPGEGCVSVTWLQMNLRLLELTGNQKYVDQIENTIYNAILPAQNPNNGEVCYFLPLIGRKRYGEVGFSPSHICCCSSSIPRGVALIPQLVAGKLSGAPAILLYTGAQIETNLGKNGKKIPIRFAVNTDFPKQGDVQIQLTSDSKSLPLAPILFNVPDWASDFTITIDEKVYKGNPGSFLTIERKWKNGDILHISMDMSIKKVMDNNKESELIALKRGPQLLALDENVSAIKKLPGWGWQGDQLYEISYLENGIPAKLFLVPFSEAGQTMANYKVLFPNMDSIKEQ